MPGSIPSRSISADVMSPDPGVVLTASLRYVPGDRPGPSRPGITCVPVDNHTLPTKQPSGPQPGATAEQLATPDTATSDMGDTGSRRRWATPPVRRPTKQRMETYLCPGIATAS